ncbi:MAG: hypothetical protein U5K30_14045 [Acidimicrobiales bacterium]|nr:hypothetical protein [Acidimicrobiales bacterium]
MLWPLLLVIPVVLSGTLQHYQWAVSGLIWGLWALSLNIVWGYAGQLSVAQLSLGGVAGYTSTLLISLHGVTLLPAVLAGVVAAVVCSLLSALRPCDWTVSTSRSSQSASRRCSSR